MIYLVNIVNSNKVIAINTVIVYGRMIVTSIIGLITVRFVLQALGTSNYGLYNAVGGIVAMLNIICTAMQTTTRRYINVEMGRPDGNMNKIFNISFILHLCFALFLLIIAETIGLHYIYNYLNIPSESFDDAVFVYQISTIVAIIGIINVPYQGLLNAFEKFGTLAIVDIITSLLKVPIIFGLVYYDGNSLRFYAVSMCLISFSSFVIYQIICYRQYREIVQFRYYKDISLYKEIICFNNYTALGAFSYIGRTQGSTMLVNYIFGTFVNGLFAIAYQIEGYLVMLISNLGTSFEPQITQTYSLGDYCRCYMLVGRITRYSILIMLIVVFPIILNLDYILYLWLGDFPEGVIVLCYWALVSLFVRSLTAGIPPLIIASGKIRAFQISTTVLMLIGIPVSYVFFLYGAPFQTIMIIMTILDLIQRFYLIILAKKETAIDLSTFLKDAYKSIIIIIPFFALYACVRFFLIRSKVDDFLHIILSTLYALGVVFIFGLSKEERKIILNKINI